MVARALLTFALGLAGCAGAFQATPEVRYEPTPMDVVQVMLDLARVRGDDVVADLGCGDGRLVIEAARRHGARGLCVDIDSKRIAEARRNAAAAGVAEHITFLNQDLFATELHGVSVVMLFLSPRFNLQLRPKLERELASGARVVSHWHDMGDWPPSQTVRVTSDGRERAVHLWTMP
ncbi:MAG TPA: methyltransferase domain-containing protein [Burkholderiales bacterium]|nr:methyltransferase domain-containing protein [Burkholderiales bacterium]